MIEPGNRAAPAWTAVEIGNVAGLSPTLRVEGHVEAQVTDGLKLLARHPQGIDSKILLLDLVVEPGPGASSHAMTDRPVTYERKVTSHQYTEVDVFREGTRVAVLKVEVAPG